ncbi:MAG: SPOR domain-containing protein [Granulicella sp.]
MRIDNDLNDSDPQEREISLGTSTILGIFLALALVCAAFFGFGYSLGRHSSTPVAASVPEVKPDTADKTDSPFSGFKAPATTTPRAADDASDSSQTDTISSTEGQTPKQAPVPQEAAKTPTPARNVSFPAPPSSTAPVAGTPSATTVTHPIVQVSATSRQGDAESLIAALKQKGYTAAIHHEPQDQLFHVQIGPFASKVEADAMRKRLDTDGYKAIVK